MNKPYEFHELSDILCGNPNCGTRIKKNVVARTPEGRPRICWRCWVMKTRNMTLVAYKKYRTARAQARAEERDPRAVKAATS
jgi:hypothetical protein